MDDKKEVEILLKKTAESNFYGEEVVEKPDGKIAWLMCFAVFNVSFITFGLLYATGIFLNAISEDLNSSVGWTSLVFSTSSGMLFMVCFSLLYHFNKINYFHYCHFLGKIKFYLSQYKNANLIFKIIF